MTLFHSWSVNGYVHRVQHGRVLLISRSTVKKIYFIFPKLYLLPGDWFGGKGVGLCQIMVQKQPVNIYIAHVSFGCFRFIVPR